MKKWYKSWTLWVNAGGAAIIGILTQVQEASPEQLTWVAAGLALGNFLLRFKTSQPII